MELIPFKVLVNPQLRVLDSSPVLAREGCCSMYGFSALVPRASRVEVTALDPLDGGKEVRWEARGWAARMLQHEVDHMNGALFVDKMQPAESLQFNYWKTVNDRRGQFRLGYGGISGVSHKILKYKQKQD